MSDSEEILDVAIVGGGVAGAYCAWRLLGEGAKGPRKVAIFEGSGRIGGRLLSVKPPGMDRLTCDLGGGYFASTQRIVASLVSKLGLPAEPVPTPLRNVFYLRGARVKRESPIVPYSFAPDEDASRREAFFGSALERLIPGITSTSSGELDRVLDGASADGRPLADWGFWNLVQRAMSPEAFRYVRDTRPDDYNLSNWNAADAIRALLSFGRETRMLHLPAGYASLPLELLREARGAGGQMVLEHRLRALEIEPDGSVRLRLARGGNGWGPSAGGEPVTVRARSVILALPRRSLELVDASGPLFGDPAVAAMLTTVTPIPMFKTFTCYGSPWWRELGYASGFAITDLPLRTSFYWGTDGDHPGAKATNGSSLLMASLSYLHEASFWGALRGPSVRQRRTAGNDAPLESPAWSEFAEDVDGPLVAETQRQLSQVHGIAVPRPYAAACADWSLDPYGGAVNFWNPRVRSKELMPRIAHPIERLPVYICGESYSRDQGWVEGALDSSERVLAAHYGLATPGWLTNEPRRTA